MAELSSPKHQPLAVSVDQEDQQRKGDEFDRRAATVVNGWAKFSGDYGQAIQLLEKACGFYKPSKAFDKLAGAHMKIARCYLKMGNVEEGASTYVAAAKYYKNIQNQGAVTCLGRAAMLFEEIGQLPAAARYYQELGDILEAEGNILESIGHYRKAAELFSTNESHVLGNQCRTKVAKHAAELQRYAEAIPIFEALAKYAVSTGASKKTVKEMFLYAGLCYLCSFGGDGAIVKQALKCFQEVEPNFTTSRESKIILYLATAFEKRNGNLYKEVLNTHEVLFRNDPLAGLLANRGKKILKSLPARSKSTKIHSSEVQQTNLPVDEPKRDSTKEESAQ